jgi:DNA-binding beta-propeller fold protein YncE
MMRTKRLGLLTLCLLLCAAGATTVDAGAALAARAHVFSLAFGGPGSAAGSMSLLPGNAEETGGSGIAVNDVTHNVYVTDTENHRIDEFTSAGEFVRAWGRGVQTGAAELQECTTASGCQQGLEGSKPGEFEVPTYIAVDNSKSASQGDVYVGDTGDNLITKFSAEGKLITTWGNNGDKAEPNGQLSGSPTEGFGKGLRGIAVDGAGNLWVFDVGSEIIQFDQAGTLTVKCKASLHESEGVGGLAVGPNGIYLTNGFGRVEHVEFGCGDPELVTALAQQEARGLALDGFDGDLYADHEGGLIEDISASCVPSAAGCAASQLFGEEQLSGAAGLAIDPGPGLVYVANSGIGLEVASQDQIVVYKVAVEGSTGEAEEVHAHSAVLHGTVNPVGTELESCRFEYGETANYESSVPCVESPADIGSGNGAVPVHAEITGLDGGKSYHFRLHAVNSVVGIYGDDKTLETSETAQVGEVSATEITGASALLSAHVNPGSAEGAHYHFEYGACTTAGECPTSPYGTNLPVPDATVAAGAGDVVVSQHIESLTAGTTYHFRIAVEDADGLATPQREGTFVFEPPLPTCATARPVLDDALADCREYELVTPPDKNGALIDNFDFGVPPAIARDGSRVLSKSIQCFHSPSSCVGIRQTEGATFSFQHTEAGWATESLTAPADRGSTMLTYNADTASVLYALAAVPPGVEEFYAREPDGTLEAIGPLSELSISKIPGVASSTLVATSDLSRVVFESLGLWPSLEGGAHGGNVFEYSGAGNAKPVLVGVSGPTGSTSLISACGTSIGGNSSPHSWYGSLSSDGRTVWFTAAGCPGGGTGANSGVKVPADALYERVEQERGMETVLASGSAPEPECDTACQAQPPGNASYEGAASDGSRVFFTDTRQLTDSASEDRHAGDSAVTGCSSTASTSSGCNLYEFVCPSHCERPSERRLVDVSAGDSSGLGPRVQGVLAIAPDGSDVYFIARGTLTVGTNKGGHEPVAGGENLYAYRDGHLSFIATLATADVPEWVRDIGVANVTSDGRFLVFTSHRGLTADTTSGEGSAQVYRYDAETEQLSRVSVGDQGYADNGNASIADARIVEAQHGFIDVNGTGRSDPSMSENGAYVFFESPTGLVPGALNDQHVTGNTAILAENVYEWAADGSRLSDGAPACARPGGCVSLISDGRDLNEGDDNPFGNTSVVGLLGTDETGSNVFFLTADQLVGQDTDSQVDLYDARVNGGFAAPVEQSPCGSIEACRPASVAAPVFGAPLASASFVGSGNLAPAPPPKPKAVAPARKTVKCKRGFTKSRKNQCVKKPKKKSKRASRDRRSK